MALYEEDPHPAWLFCDFILAIVFSVMAASHMDEPVPQDAGFFHAFMAVFGVWVVAFFAFLLGHVLTRVGFLWAWIATGLVLWIW